MRVLDRNISENTEKMLHRLFSDKETSLPVEYEYTPEETSSVTFLGDKYIIKLQKSISDQLVFEDTLLHEYTHIYQMENSMPKLIIDDISEEYTEILQNTEDIVMDIDVNRILNSLGYSPLRYDTKYKVYFPLFRKFKKKAPEPCMFDQLQWALELSFIYFTDSKQHYKNCLNCIEKTTYSISKITYAFIDNISSYISSPRNSDTIELLYSELKGIISKHFIG